MEQVREWLIRGLLALIIAIHGAVKFAALDAFTDKFAFVSPTVAMLTAVAELAGAFGIVIGGIAEHRWFRPEIRWAGVAASLLGMVCILIVQIGAVATVHWGNDWFYFSGGIEFNVVLIVLCLIVTIRSLITARALRWLWLRDTMRNGG